MNKRKWFSAIAVAVMAVAGIGITQAFADGNQLHRFGRNDPIDMRGAKVYDSTGPLFLGTKNASTHSLATGDALFGGKFESQGQGYVDGLWAFSVNPTNVSGTVKNALLAHNANVNWNVTSKTTLYTCPTGKKCYVDSVILKNGSGTSGTAACGVGWDASAVNVHASATHALTTTTYMKLQPVTVPVFGNATDVLGFKCATPEGSAYTSDVDVFGFIE